MQVSGSFLLSYLCWEIAAELELLERNSHGVGAEEENEGHEGQVRNILTGAPHQRSSILHTLFLTQLTPVEICQVKLRRQEERRGGGRWNMRSTRMWERAMREEEANENERKEKR